MATHSGTLAWKIPWTLESGRLQSMGSLESDTTERLHFHFSLSCIGEGNGNPLQCSCLENPRDGGTWWAAIFGVAQSQTRLKRLSSSSSSIEQLLADAGAICQLGLCPAPSNRNKGFPVLVVSLYDVQNDVSAFIEPFPHDLKMAAAAPAIGFYSGQERQRRGW